jgi:hypothetical protein
VKVLQCSAPKWPGLLDLLLHAKSLYLATGKPLQLTKHQLPGMFKRFTVAWHR